MSRHQNWHVRQRESCDCVIATIAAVTNVPYDVVASLTPRKPGKRGLYRRDARKLLQVVTQIKWKRPRTVFFRRLRTLCNSPDSLILFIRPQRNVLIPEFLQKPQHCIFVRRGYVFDPECVDVMQADAYVRINWIPTLAFYPRDVREFNELQTSNFSKYHKSRLWSEIIGG